MFIYNNYIVKIYLLVRFYIKYNIKNKLFDFFKIYKLILYMYM